MREIAVKDRNPRWKGSLVYSLSQWAQALISLGDQSQAIIAWQELVSLAESVLSNTADTYPNQEPGDYLHAFQRHILLAFLVEDKDSCIKISCTVIQQLQRLSRKHPQDEEILKTLMQAHLCYTRNLLRLGHFQNSLQSIQQWDDLQMSYPESRTICWPARSKFLKVDTLEAQGHAELALLQIKDFQSTSQLPLVGVETTVSLVYEARLQVTLGDCMKALEVAEKVFLGHDKPLGALMWSFIGVTHAASSNRKYERAVEVARIGIALSSDSEWQDGEDELTVFMRLYLFCMLSSGEANQRRLGSALDCAKQVVTLSLDIAEKKHFISAPTAEHIYMETRGYLAEVLLATGDHEQAQQLCEARRAYFTERVKDRIGEYRDLAPILRMLGVLYCHKGRHEEGEACARELTDIISRLGLFFPSLQDQVKIRLRYQASVPILKILDEMTDKLECEHQRGITALFKD